MKHSKHAVMHLALAAMFAALTTVTTLFLLHIHLTGFGGHGCLHVGDTMIYLAACCLPTGYACASAAIGGALADLLCGSPFWMPWTICTKTLVACCFSDKGSKILARRNLLALPCALLITVVGYSIGEAIMYGNCITALYAAVPKLIQCVISSILFVIIALFADKINFKKHLQFYES